MIVIVGVLAVLGILLMLVSLEKNTGGKEGIGCVSGAIFFVLFLLVMQSMQDSKRMSRPGPQSSPDTLIHTVQTMAVWALAFLAGVATVAAAIWFVIRARRLEKERMSTRDQWLDTLTSLSDEDYSRMVQAWHRDIENAFEPTDWQELKRRRQQ